MKKKLMVVGILVGLLLAATTSVQAISYTGSLTGNGGGIIATDGWNSASTIFTWTVQDVGTSGGFILWEYDYTFTVPTKNISHFIIEVSPNAQNSDFTILSGNSSGVDNYGDEGNSNPNIPGTVRGIKFQPGALTLSASFQTTLAPVWGDFYAKDGNSGGVQVTAWNAGFGTADTDPTADPANGSVENHILRPDTKQTTVPEPATLMLIGAGLVGLVGFGRKKR
jgi:hypothetical protein